MLSYGCQQLEHEPNHANENHRLTMIQADFVVTAKPPGLGEPAEGSFYNPPLRKNFESFGMMAAAHDLQPEFPKGTKLLHPLHQCSQIAAIGPDDLQAPKHTYQKCDQSLGGITILHRGRGHKDRQNHSAAVSKHSPSEPRRTQR